MSQQKDFIHNITTQALLTHQWWSRQCAASAPPPSVSPACHDPGTGLNSSVCRWSLALPPRVCHLDEGQRANVCTLIEKIKKQESLKKPYLLGFFWYKSSLQYYQNTSWYKPCFRYWVNLSLELDLSFRISLNCLLQVTFLYAERVDGPVAWVYDAVLCTCSHDSMVDWKARVFGNVQLPAELSDKWQTHSSHLDERGVERRLSELERHVENQAATLLCVVLHTHFTLKDQIYVSCILILTAIYMCCC